MNILVCVDDTDDVSKETSTGKIAGIISNKLKARGGVMIDGISRHQLLLSDQVKYTSHNSAMCLDTVMPEEVEKREIFNICRQCILDNMSDVSDPGFAVCFVDEVDNPADIIQFGFDAKRKVLKKELAYGLANKNKWIFLEELGGDGSGVIGALAGIGLRLSRSDGAIRGRLGEDISGTIMYAGEFCEKYGAEFIIDNTGSILGEKESVRIDDWARIVFFDGHKCCLGVKGKDGFYTLMSRHKEREQLAGYKGASMCADFVVDNDDEECVVLGTQSCFNCLYRRWTKGGFECMKLNTM